MGRTVSPGTFGHNGAGGQLAWGDPATGLSFGYCTNGLDRNVVREPRRGTALSSLAAVCTTGRLLFPSRSRASNRPEVAGYSNRNAGGGSRVTKVAGARGRS